MLVRARYPLPRCGDEALHLLEVVHSSLRPHDTYVVEDDDERRARHLVALRDLDSGDYGRRNRFPREDQRRLLGIGVGDDDRRELRVVCHYRQRGEHLVADVASRRHEHQQLCIARPPYVDPPAVTVRGLEGLRRLSQGWALVVHLERASGAEPQVQGPDLAGKRDHDDAKHDYQEPQDQVRDRPPPLHGEKAIACEG